MRAQPVLRAITFRQAEVDIHGLLSLFGRFERLEHFDLSKRLERLELLERLEPPSFDGALQTPAPPDPVVVEPKNIAAAGFGEVVFALDLAVPPAAGEHIDKRVINKRVKSRPQVSA